MRIVDEFARRIRKAQRVERGDIRIGVRLARNRPAPCGVERTHADDAIDVERTQQPFAGKLGQGRVRAHEDDVFAGKMP
jgi:hypothetical protein